MRASLLIATLTSLTLAGTVSAADVLQSQRGSRAGNIAQPMGGPVNYTLDDGANENNIGLNNTGTATATQFTWFNRFDVAPGDQPVAITQVQVFWDPTTTGAPVVGNAVSVDIYADGDTSPANGATHLYTQNVTIAQVGTTFDAYNMTSPPQIVAPNVNLLVAITDRWVTTGVSSTTFPAAIDQTATQGRSWVASASAGSPPTPPVIPSTGLFGTIDSFGLAGNWLVRAVGDARVPVELQSYSID